MTVLVLAEQTDTPVDMVIAELASRGVPVFRADTGWFPSQLVLNARLDENGMWIGQLRTEYRRVDLAEIRSIWSRGPGAFRFAAGMTDAARIYAHREARLGLGGVLAELDTRWVNHPNRSADSSYKPVQLATAARCGLTTAATVITNDPNAVLGLAGDYPGGIVQKSLGPNTITECDRIEVAFTRRLEPADLEDLSAVELTATQVQAWIDKKYEARVIVVGDQMFTILIHASSPASHVDWRADYKSLNYEWVETPSQVAKSLRGYVDRLGLAYAAVDFAIDRDDRWVFLESNSAGQYYWLEAHTGAPITSALCDLLSGSE
ncbi:MAG: ATP-grasp ribosomal peptide maturase [Pseudonocardiaceae bacterium]